MLLCLSNIFSCPFLDIPCTEQIAETFALLHIYTTFCLVLFKQASHEGKTLIIETISHE